MWLVESFSLMTSLYDKFQRSVERAASPAATSSGIKASLAHEGRAVSGRGMPLLAFAVRLNNRSACF